MEAARKRPELAGLITTHLPDVPQIYVNVDRTKSSTGSQSQRSLSNHAGFMGGFFINFFNRFGRQWQSMSKPRVTTEHAPKSWPLLRP